MSDCTRKKKKKYRSDDSLSNPENNVESSLNTHLFAR